MHHVTWAGKLKKSTSWHPPWWAAAPCITKNHAVGIFGSLESRQAKALDVLIDYSD